ncbi:hypothetical protein [Pyxidicoccus trucidator]|uniref:hypothetical protein n=1 Tax=Pyxidicoccus trucidator TaxID=2709662 RepID=UPI0013DC76CA|nr:hypothetical protein [Pyxidicoccus trucidator]
MNEQVKAIRKSAKPISSGGTAAAQPVAVAPTPKPEVNLILHFGIRKTDLKPEMVEARRTYPRAYEPWGDEELDAVAELARRRLDAETIARLLGRQPSSVERKLKEMF